jgi:molybdenum cofactor biosynthesis enzyme MoaA
MNTKRLDIMLGYECNNNCIFCVNNNERLLKLNKDTQQIKKELKEKSQEGYDTVCFSGGEVTIRKDIVELVAYSKLCGYGEIQIITNGRMLMYYRFAEKIIKAGLNTILFSVHGPDSKTHDEITCTLNSFNQTLKGIDNVIKLKLRLNSELRVWSNTTISKKNFRLLPEIVNVLSDRGIEACYFTFVNPYGSASTNFDVVVPRISETVCYIYDAIKVGRKKRINIKTEGVPFCFMVEHIDCVGETFYPKQWTIDRINNLHNDFNLNRISQGKIKCEKCEKCVFDLKCEGIWVGYANRYGFDELTPVNR